MLKLSDLALRPDMQLGPMLVSPSRRLVEGPGGQVHLEPLIMQVFLLLLDARGRVVTRGELFDQCWGGVSVGDDSLNHAIVKVRRTGAQVVPGFFEIETIPRTGYRLTGDILQVGGHSDVPATRMRRRAVLGSGLAVAAVGGGAGFWWANRPRFDPRFDALIERGQNALRLDENAAEYFRQAATLQPENAKAWGLLAYAIGSGRDSGPTAVPGPTAQLAERAARTALKLDPNEPNALLAMTFIQSVMLDWISRENEYRRILAIDPANTLAMRHLGVALHAVGRCRDSLEIVERALAIEPLTPDHQLRRAMRLWVLGRVTEADRTSDRAMQLWPSHRLVRLARLMIYAFTGRTRAALAIVEEEEKHPILLMPGATGLWRVSLAALENPTSERVASARSANLDGAQANPAMAAWAILMLSALGELDGAFEVANGFLLSRGPAVLQPSSVSKSERPISIPGWRNTFGLFTPPTKAMRLDKRFGALADGLGLTDYWKRRGIGPDDFLFKP